MNSLSASTVALVTGLAGFSSFPLLTGTSSQDVVLTREQAQILSHMRLAELSDGRGSTVTTIQITGVNVQILNGLGATNGNPADPRSTDPALTLTNGAGNLILGYDEAGLAGEDRSGSHNLIVGAEHSHTSFGAILGGFDNVAAAPYVGLVGGHQNRAAGDFAAMLGGVINEASGPGAVTAGGGFNYSTGTASAVNGSFRSGALGDYTSVNGGYKNIATGDGATVNGGGNCRSEGIYSTVCGGSNRSATGFADWAAGSLFEDM